MMQSRRYRKVLLVLLIGIVFSTWMPERLNGFDQIVSHQTGRLQGAKMEDDNPSSKVLEFSISVPKNKYFRGEPIYLRGSLKNISGQAQYVNERFFVQDSDAAKVDWGIVLHIFSETGKQVDFGIRREMPGPSAAWFVAIEPNASLVREIPDDVSPFIGEEGKYRITAFYVSHIGPDIAGVDAWQGVVQSNTLTIEIV